MGASNRSWVDMGERQTNGKENAGTDISAMTEHTDDADILPSWSGFQCIAHEGHWYTLSVKEAMKI